MFLQDRSTSSEGALVNQVAIGKSEKTAGFQEFFQYLIPDSTLIRKIDPFCPDAIKGSGGKRQIVH